MNARAVPFAQHVQRAISPWLLFLYMANGLLMVYFAVVFLVIARTHAAQILLDSVSPYLSTLVESQDRPEILRVLNSMAETEGTKFVLVQDNLVLASTRNLAEIDRPFEGLNRSISVWGSRFSFHDIITEKPLARHGGPALNALVVSYLPLRPVLWGALWVSVCVFLMGLVMTYAYLRNLKKAIAMGLRPLERLRKDIQRIGLDQPAESKFIPILELEEIRQVIVETRTDLLNTREHLAEERAKKLSAASFKSLIHDLHNPVAALRQWLRLWTDSMGSSAVREEAASMVPQIADEILRQVGAAKKNLESEPEALRESDLRECLKASFGRVAGAASVPREVKLKLPDGPVIVSHDPDLLQRALVNLLENGIEASHSKVEFSLECADGTALVRVSDDGRGMTETDLPVFLQGRGRSKKADREALGLSSANHIVRTHGGKLVYRKNSDGGATFEIRLEAR